MTVCAKRVTQRHLKAGVEGTLDQWADLFLDYLVQSAKIDSKNVSRLLQTQGISAEDLNRLDKTAAAGEVVQTLGGWVRKGMWFLTIQPFIALGKFIQSSAFRSEVKAAFRRALRQEFRATRHMLRVAERIALGESVPPQERRAALKKFVDILSRAILIVLLGPSVTSLFSGGLWKALGSLIAPLNEILIILLNKPLQAAARKFLASSI